VQPVPVSAGGQGFAHNVGRVGRAVIGYELAQQLVGLQPNIIVSGDRRRPAGDADGPIVFVNVGDPVPSGLVERLDRPSGNTTGFAILEATLRPERAH
jgi:hypothetical protein